MAGIAVISAPTDQRLEDNHHAVKSHFSNGNKHMLTH